jgi:RNA polymerase sigma-70 factor (ECF subfamily)
MSQRQDPATEDLLRRIEGGDTQAVDQLLEAHRERLRAMVSLRMDRRLAARVDASDIVQDTFLDAAARLPEFARCRPAPFYLWLRQLAWQRLIDLFRRHVGAQSRSVDQEVAAAWPLSDESTSRLAEQLADRGASPSGRAIAEELRARVQEALAKLAPADRELLVLRYVEQLSPSELAITMGVTERTLRTRHRRALERLGELLGALQSGEQEP